MIVTQPRLGLLLPPLPPSEWQPLRQKLALWPRMLRLVSRFWHVSRAKGKMAVADYCCIARAPYLQLQQRWLQHCLLHYAHLYFALLNRAPEAIPTNFCQLRCRSLRPY